ncbi:MAG: hypothetical protein F7B60_05190 [Desulfurococcales archaeon]|nr:hypothetical protein [Desulfurococcales archaeon]
MVQDVAEEVTILTYIILVLGILIPLTKPLKLEKSRIPYAFGWLSTLLFAFISYIIFNALRNTDAVTLFNGLVTYNSFSAFMLLLSALSSALVLMAIKGRAEEWPTAPAVYGLLPLIQFGLVFAMGINDALLLLAIWLLVSVASYVVIALPKNTESVKGAIKYAFMGSLATLFLTVWVALNIVITGSFTILAYPTGLAALLAFGAFILSVGFKMGIVPFHWWLPDVYGKANGYGVSIVAGIVKIGFIAVTARVIYFISSTGFSTIVTVTLASLAVVTMFWGNLAALTTRNLQRILAYSSIAHIGYILVGLTAISYAAGTQNIQLAMYSFAAVAIHVAAYAISKAPLFAVMGEGYTELNDIKGLFHRDPVSSVSMAILLLSLLGLPPLLGFWGKLYMFTAIASYSLPLLVIALLNSGISAVYYGIAIRDMLSTEQGSAAYDAPRKASLATAATIIIVAGLLASTFFHIIY